MIKIQKNNLLPLLTSHFTHDNFENIFILRMAIITVTKRQVAFGLTLCCSNTVRNVYSGSSNETNKPFSIF